ncbi:hypothetical protein RRG08_042280 [Elysia crispata]|uniref:Secreted protein n=1 Tax=Elysia crispata TaxID=231223 RepID=A0AAE1AJM5_9GAST|nr:hypothetical protein RRG08_042280 [Elysia crispata]
MRLFRCWSVFACVCVMMCGVCGVCGDVWRIRRRGKEDGVMSSVKRFLQSIIGSRCVSTFVSITSQSRQILLTFLGDSRQPAADLASLTPLLSWKLLRL